MMNCHGLLLDFGDDATLGDLALPGWTFHRSSFISTAEQLLKVHSCDVGLALLDSTFLRHQPALDQLLSHGHTEWIALVKPTVLQDAGLCCYLLRMFRDYHTLPLDQARLMVTLGHATGMARLKPSVVHEAGERGRFGMVGKSMAMQKLYRQIDKVAQCTEPVLIGGPSGTGKELVATAIHRHSIRSSAPFVAVDCGAIPASLIQSELFGHEKGAFTGAHQRKLGKIEAANGGVLFLDEIGNLPLDMQATLLRFIQERTITRLGSCQNITVDVRIIAATHVDLAQAVAEGRFREDLYCRRAFKSTQRCALNFTQGL